VKSHGQNYGFAVIGNNVPIRALMLTENITIAELWTIIQDDITANNLKRGTVKEKQNLFPGIKDYVDAPLPETEYPPPESSKPSSEGPSSPASSERP